MEMKWILLGFASLLLSNVHLAGTEEVAPTDTGVCWAMGDPHYRTFDGHFFNFMGSCSYVLAKNMHVDQTHPAFEVTAKNSIRADSHLTSVSQVAVNVYGFAIKMVHKELSMVWVNDELWNLPATLKYSTGYVHMVQSGLSLVLSTDFGLTVQYDWNSYVKVTVPNSFMRIVRGLCGDFDGSKDNDLIQQDGTVAKSIEAFGKSWRVPNQSDEEGCKDECTGDCGGCSWFKKLKADVFCGVMTPVLNFQFRKCHAVIEPHIFFDMCKFDFCQGAETKEYICDILQVYTDACQRAGVEVHDWRNTIGCPPPTCPEHSHFEGCGPACPATCENSLAPSSCTTSCVQTCACDEGYIRSGNKCVHKQDCGCDYNGRYLQSHETIWEDDNCTKKVTCTSGQIKIESTSCGPDMVCEVKNGARGCQPMKPGVCVIQGDPHYTTFDDQKYDFMGTCTYLVASSCHLEGSNLTPFSVVVENEKWVQNPKTSVAKLVAVTVDGMTIILRRNQIGYAMVNGAILNIPMNLNEGKITVQQVGTNYVISTNFGLKVTYDLVYLVTVTVPATYSSKTCGLCGNFNKNRNDDLQLPDGSLAKDTKTFAEKWKIGVPGVVCDDGCVGDDCPKCAAAEKTKIESSCSIITNPSGPFAACHAVLDPAHYYRSCVYDVCAAGQANGRNMLCHSINAYVINCQDAGVKVLNWRTPELCPMTCKPNSHYEICASPCKTPCPGLTKVACADVCAEGCACDSGALFNGTSCVPKDQCSCYVQGKTLKIGETEISDDCKTKYVCSKSGEGSVLSMSCNIDETCAVKNGVRGCYQKKCTLGGNGALTTFNGRTEGIRENGVYDVVKICDDSTGEGWFRIAMQLQFCKEMNRMAVVGIMAFLGDTTVLVNSRFETWVNGKKVVLPWQMVDISIHVTNDQLIIEKKSAVVMSYNTSQEITVTVNEAIAEKVCGACGAVATAKTIAHFIGGDDSGLTPIPFSTCPQ